MRNALAVALPAAALFAAALILPISSAIASDVKATSRITAVTVFPRGAEVVRVAKARIDAGGHTVVLADLPLQAQPASIRVEARSNGRLSVGAVDSRRLAVPRTDAETTAGNRRRIEDEIERLKDDRARLEADLQAAEAQKALLTNLAQLPGRGAPSAVATSGGHEDWAQILALLAKELAPVQKSIVDAGIRIREADRKIKDAEGRLRAEAAEAESRTEVRIAVAAEAPLDAEIMVRYQVAEAMWAPVYDARLSTGTKTAAPKLTIARRATIAQRTAEPWDAVELSLSTTRPSAGTAAPDLRPITVDFVPDRPPPVAQSMPAAPQAPRAMSGAAMDETSAGDERARRDVAKAKAADAAPMTEAVRERADIQAGAFQAVYAVRGTQTVANTGEPRRVLIDESDFETTLTARAVPRVEERAFLYAKLTVPRATPWLPGQVALFRDATFVGNGRLPQLAPGQDHDLGFGADDRVSVRAASIDEHRADSGLISTTRTDSRSYKLTIRNLHERPIAYVIQDQLPVANNQEIKVELVAKPNPTKRDIDDKRGVLAWEDKLGPDEERTIEFGYRVSWPAAKPIIYGR